MYYCSRGPTFTIVVEAPRFAHQVGRKLRGLLSRWVSLGLNDLRSPPTLSNDSRDLYTLTRHYLQAGGSPRVRLGTSPDGGFLLMPYELRCGLIVGALLKQS